MKTSSKMLFMTMTISSTFLIMNSSNWMNLWLGMEINLMSFIPLMSESKNPFLTESKMMYFLIQSLASIIMLMSILTSKSMFMNLIENNSLNMIIMAAMMMKMGMPPFHFWFPEMMNKMKWNMCFLLMTWQKMGPMYILSKVLENNKMNMIIVTVTALVGAISGINQTSTRKMMSYSSINHLSWIIMLMMSFKECWLTYMMLYIMMMAITCLIMFKYNILYINQMKTFSTNLLDKMIILTTIMSLGGLPPFLGFLPKMMTIQFMIKTNEMLIMLIMTISALIVMSYYLKMSSSINLMSSSPQKWMNMSASSKNMFMYMMIVNTLFPMSMLLIFL